MRIEGEECGPKASIWLEAGEPAPMWCGNCGHIYSLTTKEANEAISVCPRCGETTIHSEVEWVLVKSAN